METILNAKVISDAVLNEIDKTSSDISKHKHFIDQLKSVENDGISKMYIVTKKNYQIELNGVFSNDASKTLINLIIDSRNDLVNVLSNRLLQLQLKN